MSDYANTSTEFLREEIACLKDRLSEDTDEVAAMETELHRREALEDLEDTPS